nr:MAG TPA: hypothetical protein [Caudoviricetes sp.]
MLFPHSRRCVLRAGIRAWGLALHLQVAAPGFRCFTRRHHCVGKCA